MNERNVKPTVCNKHTKKNYLRVIVSLSFVLLLQVAYLSIALIDARHAARPEFNTASIEGSREYMEIMSAAHASGDVSDDDGGY